MKIDVTGAIPLEIAERLCEEIRAETQANWHTETARWCWNCQKSTGGDPTQRGFLRSPGNRGCTLINARYSQVL